MAMSFSELKRNQASSLDNIKKELEKSAGNKKTDDRFWEPTVDKAGNGFAIIRFLPEPAGEDVPFTKFYDHGFKGPNGKWYIEKSRTSINEADPVNLAAAA